MSAIMASLLRCQRGRGSISGLCRMSMSSSPSVIIEKENGLAIVSLNNPPVNSLGLEFMQDIITAIDTVEKDAKGLILTSSNKSIFCAGLDLKEMYKPDETRLREFWYVLLTYFRPNGSRFDCQIDRIILIPDRRNVKTIGGDTLGGINLLDHLNGICRFT